MICRVCGAEDLPGCGPCLDSCPHTFEFDQWRTDLNNLRTSDRTGPYPRLLGM